MKIKSPTPIAAGEAHAPMTIPKRVVSYERGAKDAHCSHTWRLSRVEMNRIFQEGEPIQENWIGSKSRISDGNRAMATQWGQIQ